MAYPARQPPIGDPPDREARLPDGPFRAEHVFEGDHYEIARGHAIQTLPASGRHGGGSGLAFSVLDTDPLVPGAGVDVGFSPDPKTLRAPDVAVTPHTDADGWVSEYPPLAIEYAGRYQRERELQDKIRDLLAGGTRFVWVVRLTEGPTVEIYEPGRPMRAVGAGEPLLAPGILQNPVPAEALWDREAAHTVALRNLLQRYGYEDLTALVAEARREGEARGVARGAAASLRRSILTVLEARGAPVSEAVRARLSAEADPDALEALLRAAVAGDDLG